MRCLHGGSARAGTGPSVAGVRTRCPRCMPGTIDLGCDQLGHQAARLLARAGWTEGREVELRGHLDDELVRLRNVGPATSARIEARLRPPSG